MIPAMGIPLGVLAKKSGKTRSLAAASDVSATIAVQPFRAPMPEMTAPMATTVPNQSPNITVPASANGAVLFPILSAPRMPNTAVVQRM